MASAMASVRRALSTCRASIIRPSTVTTPRPSAAAAVNASMTSRAASTSSVGGRPGVVGRLDLARGGQRLAVEAHLDALAALGGEALVVADVVEHAVEDRHAGLARREHGGRQVRREVGAPGDAERRAELTGEVVGADHEHADARVGGDGADVEDRRRRLDHGPDRGRRRAAGVEPGGDVVDVRRAGRPWGSRRPTAPGAGGGGEVVACPTAWPGRCSGSSAGGGRSRPTSTAATACSRAQPLASGATASSRSKMMRVARDRLRLLQRPGVGRRHVQDRAQRPDVIASSRVPDGRVAGGQLGIAGGQLLGELDDDLALLHRRVVLHLARRAGPRRCRRPSPRSPGGRGRRRPGRG